MLWLLSGPPGFTCWISFAQVFSFLPLCPYLCFISFIYLHLYVLGNDALIRYGSYMQTKTLCVLIHIRTKEVGAL